MKTTRRTIWLLIALQCIALSCSTEYISMQEESSPLVQAPLSNMDIPFTEYQVGTGSDTVLSYATGSKLIIPGGAFLDEEGSIVQGKVDILYREFHNPLDYFLAGIPMTTASGGTPMAYESAGMVEISASEDGRPVFPNPERSMQLQMASNTSDEEYNIYYLDTVTGNWEDRGKDSVSTVSYDDEVANLPAVPVRPQKATPFSFSIFDETGLYPELAEYRNVLFQPVDGKPCGFTATKITISAGSVPGTYDVTFIVDAYGTYRENVCTSYLAFKEGKDYNAALEAYKRKYRRLIKKREKAKQELEAEWAAWRYFVEKEEIKSAASKDRIIRTLKLDNFGIINIDRIRSYPEGAQLLANFQDQDGNKLHLSHVNLVDKARNTVFKCNDTVMFDPGSENILWGLTLENHVAYFTSNDFKRVDQKTGEYTFAMNVHRQELKSYEEIKELLF